MQYKHTQRGVWCYMSMMLEVNAHCTHLTTKSVCMVFAQQTAAVHPTASTNLHAINEERNTCQMNIEGLNTPRTSSYTYMYM